MFLLLGGTLSFIMGLVGVLNFFDAILTGITARRWELAVLQSVGMTMRTNLAPEGLRYTLGSIMLALVLICVTTPFVGTVLSNTIWFFAYHFTLWAAAAILPLFALLDDAIPIATCRISPVMLGGGAAAGQVPTV